MQAGHNPGSWTLQCAGVNCAHFAPNPTSPQAGENPANWMLDVAGGSAAGASKGPDFVALYKASQCSCIVIGVLWAAL